MGSFCKPSTVTTKSSSSTSALPEYAAAYKQLIPQYQQAGAAAFDPATQQGVAGFTQPQFQAFDATQANQGVYQPYLGAAGALTAQGAGPAAGGIGAYINPFTQNVVNSAMNDWQEQSARTMQQVNSNAANVGALTGDRSQVAQQLAREAGDRALSSNIANLYQSGFNTALGAAQNDQNRYLQAGQQFAGLGGLAQQYGYQDVNALLGIGGMQQQQNQAVLDADTANAQLRQQYPMYMLDWMRGGLTGLGSAAGQNSTGTQQQPGPSMFQQVAGLGLSAAGLYNNWGKPTQTAANGGRIGGGDGMSKLISDVSAAADGLAAIRRKCGGRVGYMDGGEVEDETNPWTTTVKPMGLGATATPPTPVAASSGLGNLGLSGDAGSALMAAGFGMMGSNSPNALSALGEGGLAGLSMYEALSERRRKEAMQKAKENEGRMFEMNGRLVRALPDGTVQEIYNAPVKPTYEKIGDRLVQIGPDGVKEVYAAPSTADVSALTKNAPPGKMWVDPNDPSKGVVDIPGAERPAKMPNAIQTEASKAEMAYNSLIPAIEEYVNTVRKFGAEAMPGKAKDIMGQQLRDIQLQMKELYNLGVLNGPDLSLMEQMLYDPRIGFNPMDWPNALGAVERTEQSADELKKILRRIRDTKAKEAGREVGGAENPMPNAEPQGEAPQVGAVMEGYRFKGGDPADQSNWERVN